MRLFFALWPDEGTRTRLIQLQHGLKARSTRPGNLHMTLAFLGEQAESLLPGLRDLLHGVSMPELRLTIDRISYRKRQRMLWAGMHQVPDALPALHDAICTGLEQRGIAFDRRTQFTPHITLTRDAEPTESMRFEPIVWHACQLVLAQSVTEKTGAVYRVVDSCFAKAENEAQESDRT